MITVSAPGKLFLSGEWAVLEMGNPGIVAAVNKRVFAKIGETTGDFLSVSVDDFGIRDARAVFNGKMIEWGAQVLEAEKEKLLFVKAALEAALEYQGTCRPFRMRSWGEDTVVSAGGEQKKVGFGSSAAAVVATVAAVLAFSGQDVSSREGKERVYKLSTIAHYLAQGKIGSAFDVAASTYGGVFVYKRFDPQWLMEKLEAGIPLKQVVDQPWKGLLIEPLAIPEGFELLVGWTRESASTTAMIKQMDLFKKNRRAEYDRLYGSIAGLVRQLIPEWKKGNRKGVLALIQKNEDLLRELGQKSGVLIETDGLRKMSALANQAGAAGKLSGAGGGDCGIAVSFDRTASETVRKAWATNGFSVIDTTVSPAGVQIERV